MPHECRHATRPHYRRTAEAAYLGLIWVTFVAGALCGATITLGVMQ